MRVGRRVGADALRNDPGGAYRCFVMIYGGKLPVRRRCLPSRHKYSESPLAIFLPPPIITDVPRRGDLCLLTSPICSAGRPREGLSVVPELSYVLELIKGIVAALCNAEFSSVRMKRMRRIVKTLRPSVCQPHGCGRESRMALLIGRAFRKDS